MFSRRLSPLEEMLPNAIAWPRSSATPVGPLTMLSPPNEARARSIGVEFPARTGNDLLLHWIGNILTFATTFSFFLCEFAHAPHTCRLKQAGLSIVQPVNSSTNSRLATMISDFGPSRATRSLSRTPARFYCQRIWKPRLPKTLMTPSRGRFTDFVQPSAS